MYSRSSFVVHLIHIIIFKQKKKDVCSEECAYAGTRVFAFLRELSRWIELHSNNYVFSVQRNNY